MAARRQDKSLQEADNRRFLVAFGLAAILHLAVISAYQWLEPLLKIQKGDPLSKQLEPAMRYVAIDLQLEPEKEEEKKKKEEENDLEFVDVNPEAATEDKPEDTRYYSAITTRASNPEPSNIDVGVPKIDGRQTDLVRFMDVRPDEISPPSPPPSPEFVVPEREPSPMNTLPRFLPDEQLADMTPTKPGRATEPQDKGNTLPQDPVRQFVRKSPQPPKETPLDPGEAQPESTPSQREKRPRTIAEAKIMKGITAGEMMHQDGGVSRAGVISPDSIGTPMGVYDSRMINAISQRWYSLIDQMAIGSTRTGHVRISFRQKSDGSVSQVEQLENTTSVLWGSLCERAIEEPAPFEPWPSEMRRMSKENYRDITFTFYYQ